MSEVSECCFVIAECSSGLIAELILLVLVLEVLKDELDADGSPEGSGSQVQVGYTARKDKKIDDHGRDAGGC